ncbi:MAG: helix-turn-helix transcriptional regulator [Sciscionella sp.]|nr:helix-turn-helix transcriptional regulator [Sciscionella sp.]
MDARYAEPLVIDDLAAAAGCSRYHFIRLFTQAYGETPGAYLARRRIERAKDLLRSANLTVTEICMLVGYASLGTFSRRFTEIVGMSPSTYRARARRDGPPPIPGCFVFAWSRPNGKIDKPGKTAITEKPTGSLAD